MISKWYSLKEEAIKLRRNGASLREVEKTLNIPRSTLSLWFRNIQLNKKQQLALTNNWLNALSKARKGAVIWHNKQKEIRLEEANKQATSLISLLDLKNKHIQELALAMLYLGEGFKSKSGTGMGNSDPLILKFFVYILIKNYGIDINKIYCELHLRMDQNPNKMKLYWSKKINIPIKNFRSVSIDKRTAGSPTYPTYNGVCVLRYGNIAIQRRLLFLAQKFCNEVIKD